MSNAAVEGLSIHMLSWQQWRLQHFLEKRRKKDNITAILTSVAETSMAYGRNKLICGEVEKKETVLV